MPSLSFENSTTRAFDGAIVTFRNTLTDELRVEHRGGFVYESRIGPRAADVPRVRLGVTFIEVIGLLCAEADTWPGDWKVVTICTPTSIYNDLRSERPASMGVPNYEATTLSRAGRIDMWDGQYTKDSRERMRKERGHARPRRHPDDA